MINGMDRFTQKSTFFKSMQYDSLTCEELVGSLWNNPDQLIDSGERLKKKHCVRTTVALKTPTGQCVVKRHVERSWRHIVKQWFCISRAQRCFNDTLFLVENGYPTPRPIAYWEERLGPLRGRSYYVYEFAAGTTLRELAGPMKNQRLLRQYVKQLAEIWRLHWQLDVNLHDGHPENFIVAPSGKIWVIDLDKLQYLRGMPHTIKRESLTDSFMQTLQGVFGDYRIVNYGKRLITEMFASAKPLSSKAA